MPPAHKPDYTVDRDNELIIDRVGDTQCDLRNPSCSNCEIAGVPCLIHHTRNHTEVPRNYVSELEAEIEKLTRENQELRTLAQSSEVNGGSPREHFSPGSADTGALPRGIQDLVKSVRDVVSGGITLAKLVISTIRADALPSPLSTEPRSYGPSSFPMPAEASLPPRHAADHLVDVYFQYRTPHLPIVDRSRVKEAVESAYQATSGQEPPDRAIERDIFTAYMIFAIALCDVSNPSGGRPSQSEGCFQSAVRWLERVMTGLKSDIETLRTILLLAQFIALSPSQGSLWHLTGTALRLCVDAGLHWESEDQAISMDPALLYDRRRLWYTTYQLDRMLCIPLGRPFGIIDESTCVPLPNPWAFDIHNQRAHNHLFNFQVWAPRLAYPRPNYAAWLRDIQPRLEEWYATIPQLDKAYPSSIFASKAYWDYLYNNAILLLYRPNATVSLSHTSLETVMFFFQASCQLIGSIKALQREGKIDILWKSVHQLFMAGLGVIYSLWRSKEVRDRDSIGSSISTLQSCASTLSALAESFPAAAGCRDVFDTLSAATVDWLVNNNAAELSHGRQEFEKQIEDLLQQLQPSRRANDNNGIDMPGMLSADSFAFSEMLSSAAQCPDLQESGFSGPTPDSIGGVAPHIFL
ncbi:hypothetical protein GQ53DRAFT_776174 [Thozetella sp. PMI_491]|nr:hypothetical protein GQ53DRAFT_776174 [Thozetella sp. PMI_491]